MVRLWTELTSRSSGLAVLMTPLRPSMLKKRSRSVFLSMEYLDRNAQTHLHNQNKQKQMEETFHGDVAAAAAAAL